MGVVVETQRAVSFTGDTAEKAVEALNVFAQLIYNLPEDYVTPMMVVNGTERAFTRADLITYNHLYTDEVAPIIAAADSEASQP